MKLDIIKEQIEADLQNYAILIYLKEYYDKNFMLIS